MSTSDLLTVVPQPPSRKAMSAQYFRCDEHVIPCQHLRSSPRALGSQQDAVLQLAIKQYTPLHDGPPRPGDVTCIAAHANGMPKELYEPMWDALYLYSKRTRAFRIRSIWIADVYFQGESGVLNESVLGNDPNWFDHARDLLQMVNHFRDQMPAPIVGIGHSMGGNTIVNLALLHPRLMTTMVLSEATLKRIPAGRVRSSLSAAYGATFRKDIWPSREEAAASLRKNRLFQTFDPRAVELFIQHGLRELPTALYPHLPAPSSQTSSSSIPVTLKTTKHQEALGIARGAYPKPGTPLSSFRPSRKTHLELATGAAHRREVAFYRPESYLTYDQLPNVQPTVLYIFAENAPEDPSVREDITTHTGIGVCGNGGIAEGGVKKVIVSGAGHFVPMEKPREVAELAGDWLAKELKRWAEDEAEEERTWRSLDPAAQRSVDDDYKFWMKENFGKKIAGQKGPGKTEAEVKKATAMSKL